MKCAKPAIGQPEQSTTLIPRSKAFFIALLVEGKILFFELKSVPSVSKAISLINLIPPRVLYMIKISFINRD